MHGVPIEKIKPCNMHMQIFHFTVRAMPTYRREREYFLLLQNQKFPNNNLEHKIEYKKLFPNSFLFSESNKKGEESLFLKEKQEAHYMHMHSIFRFFLKHR